METIKPGEVILRKLFHEFTILADKKIDQVLNNEPLERPFAKSLQRGEDPIFDQLLTAFGAAAEHCLPSQLRVLFEWHDRQLSPTSAFSEDNLRLAKTASDSQSSSSKSAPPTKVTNSASSAQAANFVDQISELEIYYILEKRDLAIEFIFCLVLIEVLKQLPLHPGYDELTAHIENLAFKRFKFREDVSNPNLANINMIADLYAEVIGVLAQSRFQSVRKRFMADFKELRAKEPSPIVTHNIISLLMGMKFFRVKMVPIEEFEASFQFMHECAVYFLEVKDKDLKHALAGLFVEILVPVAATVKNEVNVPCLKNFVELLYNPTLDLCTKRKHCLALFPLVTCLLCVSQKQFFLSSWHYFLAMCLSHLKNRDPKMSRVALESLYRLLWVYMIRIKCESNTATQSRLHSIVNSLFPKGSKAVVPRDTPLNIFVKIIQFIAQERLDFAMKEIVFDLLSVGRSIKIILTPERMSIGLRSFLVVADSLQQKDGEPPMPRSLGVLPSGNTLRVKKTFLNKMLTDEMAKNIGMNHYYPYVRKTLSDILRALDVQFGRPLMATNVQNFNKEPDDMITGERKPKIDLFRTCIAAIPRLIPDGIAKNDLIDLLARLTVHMDEEMSMLAFQSLTNLVVDFTDWREDVIDGFVHFVLYDIGDQFQPLIENALKMLFQLMNSWKNAIQTQIGVKSKVQSPSDLHHHHHHGVPLTQSKMDQIVNVLYKIEALSLVMLCYCRQPIRKLAAFILKETKIISNLISGMMKLNVSSANVLRVYDEPVGSVIDAICPLIIESCFPYISSNERATITAMCNQVDLQWVAERGGASWVLFERISDTNLNEKAGGTDSGRSSEARSESRSTTISSVTNPQSNPTPVGTVSSHQSMTSSMSSAIGSSIYSSDSTDGASPADDELKLNAWSVCLMAMMNEVMVKCPNVTSFCWNYVFVRLKTLFSQIDPNPVNDNRSLILRGSTSSSNLKRSISSFDRSFFIELWKNYLMMACCVAPSSIVTQPTNPTPPPSQKYPQSHHQQATSSMLQENCTSPDSSLSEKISSQQQSGTQSIEGNRSPVIQARGRSYSVQNLFKMTIELVRCEQVDLRKAVILGLSQVNPNALADLLEELIPFFREAIDRKQNEKLRSRKRRELLRVQIGRLFKFISERKIFAQCPAVVLDNRDNYSLSSVLIEYIDGVRMYLESETDKMIESSSYILDIKQSYCHFICSLVKSFPIEQRTNKLSRELRQNLFNLFAGWSGKYGQMFLNSNYQYASAPLDFTGITELEFLSIKSMSTVLCSGSLFDQKNLLDGNSLYYWLTSLLNSKERRINEIGLDTLILLLENNLDAGPLLEWLVECCYTKNAKIADACFTALATIFSIREYPCDRYIAIIIVTIVNVACPRIEIQQLALQLLQILDARFFTGSSSYRSHDRSGTALESSPRGGLKNAEDVKVGHSRGQLQRSNYQLGIGANSGSNHNHYGTSSAGGGPLGLEPLLLNLYPCTQANIAKRMAYLHPQLTMIVFSEITYRFQTARPTVCQNLLNFLVPWLYNMQLVDPTAAVIGSLFVNENVHHHHPSSVVNLQDPDDPGTPPPGIYSRNAFEDPMQHSYGSQFNGATREGWGSVESTEMVLNNLFFITIKFGDDYAPELEKVWSSICVNRPNNLKIIIRYLFILTGLSPNELLPYAKRIAICLAKSQPEHLIDILMTELQAVEFLSFNAERTEAFPYFRIVNRKCSASHLLDDADVPNVRRIDSTTRDAGTLHTKRHSKDLHGKYLDQPMVTIPGGGNESNGSTTTGGIASSNTSSEECNIFGELNLSNDDSSLPISERCTKPSTPQPRPLPMPEYGGYYAPLNDFLLNTSTNGNGTNFMNGLPLPLSGGGFPAVSGSMGGFHRCNLALMLLTDIITQDIQVVDWSPHIPLMLHILFLGMDHSKSIVYEHCKQLLLNLLIVGTKHRDNLNVARILLNNRIQRQTHGLSMPFQFPYTHLNYMITGDGDETDATAHDHHHRGGASPSSGSGVNKGSANPNGDLDLNRIFTKSTENVVGSSPVGGANSSTSPEAVNLQDIQLNIDKNISEGSESGGKNSKMFQHSEMMNNTSERQKFSLDCYIKTLIDFISSKQAAPLWNYEDITAKLWQIKSGEQIGCFVEHVLFVFKESIPYAKIENRWAEIALQLALSCSSRHYAGRSLQIFRALKIPINTRMLSDILSRLVETISEQGEDMQGYVTELMLTLESAIDSFDFKPRNILELINEYFHFEVDMEEEDELDDHEHGNNHDGLLEEEDDHDLNDTELELPGTNASTPKKDQQEQDHEFINTSGGTTSETNDTLPSTSSSSTLVTTGGAPGGIPTSQSHTDSLANSKVQLKMPLRSTSYSMSFPTRKFNFLDDGRQSGSSSSATRFRTTTDVDQFYSNGAKGSGGGSNSRTGMGRSQSVQSLMKNAGDYGSDSEQPNQTADYPTFDDKTSILAQFFWIAVILLETDYEHEFALALRLLDKVLEKVSLEDPECQEKIEKIFVHFKWHNFPGVHALLLKGFACPGNYEATIHLLHKLTPLLKISVIDPTKSETAFPFHVMAMLPYMLNNYDDPSPLCIQAAVSFAQWCNENSSKLENLATVMTLYSKRCFSKENSQWIKCVVKYLYDAYPNSFVGIISFLVEVAEKGHQSYLPHILSILHFMLNYIDLSTARLINVDILRVANRYIEGPQWKDALKILKLAVSRSSSLAAPSYSSSANYPSSIISSIVSCGAYSDCISIASSSFAESEFSAAKQRELPGRTMDFAIDLSQTPIVGYKFIQKRQQMFNSVEQQQQNSMDSGVQESIQEQQQEFATENSSNSSGNNKRSNRESRIPLEKLFEVKETIQIPPSTATPPAVATSSVNPENPNSNTLKRTVSGQIRIRERLIGLLNRCGQRIGGLPKSPSVIFSQNSDIIECHAKSSMASSVEELSATNNDVSNDSKHDDTAHGEFAFFKEFDFLEYELESQEGESLDNFNWGVRRKSLSNLDNSLTNEAERVPEGGGTGGGLGGSISYSTGTLKPSSSDHQRSSIVVTSIGTGQANAQLKNVQKVDNDFSSDDEVESVSPLYDGGATNSGSHHLASSSHHHHHHGHQHQLSHHSQGGSSTSSSHHNQDNQNHHLRNSSRPSSLISHGSSHSLGSDTEQQYTITSVTPINIITEPALPEAEDPNQEEEEEEEESIEQWSSHFIQLINDNTGTTSAMSNQILALIFRNTFSKVIELTRECCDLLPLNSPDSHIATISPKFFDLLEIVSSPIDFPFVFIDPKLFITIPKLLERHRFSILELHAHWETYNEKRDTVIDVLQKCQRAVLRSQQASQQQDGVLDGVSVSKLCKMMYKMHFQLFLLFECYLKFVDILKSIAEESEVQNYSTEISNIKLELAKCLSNVMEDLITGSSESGSETFNSLPIEGTSLTKENEEELKRLIQSGQYSKAVKLVHVFKENIPDLFSDDCIEAILTIYCRSIFDNQSSYLVVTEHNLGKITRQLRETSYEINNLCLS